jgi:hypothetical protein
MDPIVLRAMAKWPDVPAVYGWLALDMRGNWLIKGERIGNALLAEFIARNYAHDEAGRWFFQNGPQRVFVSLAYTPLVLGTSHDRGEPDLVTHTGARVATIHGAWVDEVGHLLIEAPQGIGLVSDRDLPEVVDWLTDGGDRRPDPQDIEAALGERSVPEGLFLRYRDRPRVPLLSIRSGDVAARFRFEPNPRPAPGEPEC